MSLNQLAINYRPKNFSDVVGHELSVMALKGMVESKDLPTGLLFSGASGSGKTTLARIIASNLDASVIEVDAASNGGVAEVRKLMEALRYSSGRPYSVLVIDEVHSLSRDAFNALLKTLEEPPEGVLFILVTTDPHKVPKTVRTRLIEFDFRPVSPVDILKRLVQVAQIENIQLEVELIKYIAINSGGSVRKALTDMGMCSSSGVTSLSKFLEMTGTEDSSVEILNFMNNHDLAGMFELVDDCLTKVSSPQVIVDQLVISLRDLMIIRSKAGDENEIDQYSVKEKLARSLVPERIFAMLRILWDLKTQVKSKGDPKYDLELAVALLYEIATKGRTAPAT